MVSPTPFALDTTEAEGQTPSAFKDCVDLVDCVRTCKNMNSTHVELGSNYFIWISLILMTPKIALLSLHVVLLIQRLIV